jgi:hypothetical protein
MTAIVGVLCVRTYRTFYFALRQEHRGSGVLLRPVMGQVLQRKGRFFFSVEEV